jgi:hypothetical protein
MRNVTAFRVAIGALAALTGVFATADAFAESGECARLRAAIASAAPHGGGGQFAGAAARQRSELARTNAYANSIGCNNQKFLFFGSEPPPQCSEIKGQIARMQASLSDLEAHSGGGRDDLIARYNAQCGAAAAPQPGNIFEALFGGGARLFNPETLPPEEQQQTIEKSIENEKKSANASAGSYGVCVRTCDGSFFPVSYSGASERLEDVCRSLCPAADVQIYSFPFGGTIEQAVSVNGERYVDMPNALKFQQSVDPTCSCRRKGESWAEALAAAEAKYGHEAKDILVTPERSLEMSRPIIAKVAADPKAKPGKTNGKPGAQTPDQAAASPAPSPSPSAASDPSLTGAGQGLNANGEDTALSAAAATVSRETSGIGGDAGQSSTFYNTTQGKIVTQTGPTGLNTKVRIVGPAL